MICIHFSCNKMMNFIHALPSDLSAYLCSCLLYFFLNLIFLVLFATAIYDANCFLVLIIL